MLAAPALWADLHGDDAALLVVEVELGHVLGAMRRLCAQRLRLDPYAVLWIKRWGKGASATFSQTI